MCPKVISRIHTQQQGVFLKHAIVWSLSAILLLCNTARADLSAERIHFAKHATALVIVPAGATRPAAPAAVGRSIGTAFCIDASGTFVTNAHILAVVPGSKISLVLNPNEVDQKWSPPASSDRTLRRIWP